MEELVHQLVTDFPQNPGANSRTLRKLADENWPAFLPASLAALVDGGLSHGSTYLVSLLLRENALCDALCDPALLTILQAAEIAKIALAVDRQFGVDLVRRLTSLDPSEVQQAERILRIVEEILDSMLVRPSLAPLLRHSSSRIRSKAALLIGRSNKSPGLAWAQVIDSDARVRANAIEALWNVEDQACEEVFGKAVSDPHQRVAGNGAVGLYKLQKVTAIRILHELANRPNLESQITAIWAMGTLGSPRFQPAITDKMLTGDPKLRVHALRSLARIRQASRASQLAGLFSISLSRNGNKLILTVSHEAESHVSKLSPMDFLVFNGEQLLQEYAVAEHIAPSAVRLAFLIPATFPAASAAALASLDRDRPQDRFCVHRYGTESSPKAPPHVNPISSSTGILGLLARVEIAETADLSIAGAIAGFAAVLHSIMGSAARRIIFIYGDTSVPVTLDEIKEAVIRARRLNIVIDAIGPPDSPEASLFDALCRDTGGVVYPVSTHDEIFGVLERVRLSMLDYYEIWFPRANPEAQDLTVEIWSPRGYGEATLSASPSSRAAHDN